MRPLPGQSGLSCGGDSQTGPRLANEDRTIATDLQDYGSAHAWGRLPGGCHSQQTKNLRLLCATIATAKEWELIEL